jgi:hypothetical protein
MTTDEETYAVWRQVHFPDRLREMWVVFRIDQCSFPSPGWYEAAILVDGESVASHRFLVYSGENTP